MSRSANLGDYGYLVTTEASMVAILLPDTDYEDLLVIPPNALEFDRIGRIIVRSEGKSGGPQDNLDGC